MRTFFVLAALLFLTRPLSAQSEFGSVPASDIGRLVYPSDTSAAAAYLLHDTVLEFGTGFRRIVRRHVRIQAFKPEGLVHSRKAAIPFEDNVMNVENVLEKKAFLHRISLAGAVERIPLGTESVRLEPLDPFRRQVVFYADSAKPGDVLEYFVVTESKMPMLLPRVPLQLDLPAAQLSVTARIPDYYRYEIALPARFKFSKDSRQTDSQYFQFVKGARRMDIGFPVTQSFWAIKNSSAYPTEPGAINRENYRPAISFYLKESGMMISNQLRSADMNNFMISNPDDFGLMIGVVPYSTDWKSPWNAVMNSRFFGDRLKPGAALKKEMAALKLPADPVQKAAAVFDAVAASVRWNGAYALFASANQKAWQTGNRTGNSSDVNLHLIAALRSAGIDAYPVFASAGNAGAADPKTGNIFQFDLVLAAWNNGPEVRVLNAACAGNDCRQTWGGAPVTEAIRLPVEGRTLQKLERETAAITQSSWVVTARLGKDGRFESALQESGPRFGDASGQPSATAANLVLQADKSGNFTVPALFPDLPFAGFFSGKDRITPLSTGGPVVLEIKMELEIAEGLQPVSILQDANLQYGNDVSYRRTIRFEAGKLTAVSRLELGKPVFQPAEYAAVKALLDGARAAHRSTLTIGPAR